MQRDAMIRPLTKHTRNGDCYARPTNIEAAIAAALELDQSELSRRAAVNDRRSTDYLPSECLVHLIRKAHRDNNVTVRDRMLVILLGRCEVTLAKTLRDDQAPNAAYLRSEVLGQLGELFADDGTGDNPDELDYFEVRFNHAFATLRADRVRAERRTLRRSLPLPDDEVMAHLPDVVLRNPATQENSLFQMLRARRQPSDARLSPATQEDSFFLKQLLQAINTLPPEEREAVILCCIMGYKEESDDPAERTAATICGVTGRTIRNRLIRARQKLSKFTEDL
jgi:DNA-directed RNA polymerase specialized sigma24 family protein